MTAGDLNENPVKELLRRFLVTFLLGVVVYRFGVFVTIPGVQASVLKDMITPAGGGENSPLQAILQYANMFNGGSISNASIFGLGITPYISASIIFQLLAFSIPSLKALQKEGESGRRKINQYTRYATLLIAIIQSALAAWAMTKITHDDKVLVDLSIFDGSRLWFVAQSMLVITTGCMLILWICEQITRFGIGNGVSVVIAIGILSTLPAALAGGGGQAELPHFLGIALVSLCIIAGIVVVVQAVRRINLEQQRRIQGNKVYGGAQTTLPLKLNQANVIPVIFASPVMVLLGVVLGYMVGLFPALQGSGVDQLFHYGNPFYRYVFSALIIFFTFFYISITFDLFDLSNHFKQAGFFVRGIKPGKNTVDYLAFHLKRITFVGAIFLAMVAVLPDILDQVFNLSGRGGRFLMGGTGLLIVVGVSLDIMQKVSAFFLAQQFRGLAGSDLGGAGSKKGGKRF